MDPSEAGTGDFPGANVVNHSRAGVSLIFNAILAGGLLVLAHFLIELNDAATRLSSRMDLHQTRQAERLTRIEARVEEIADGQGGRRAPSADPGRPDAGGEPRPRDERLDALDRRLHEIEAGLVALSSQTETAAMIAADEEDGRAARYRAWLAEQPATAFQRPATLYEAEVGQINTDWTTEAGRRKVSVFFKKYAGPQMPDLR
jgi:hypothetical protein